MGSILHIEAFVLHIWPQNLNAYHFTGHFMGVPLVRKFAPSDALSGSVAALPVRGALLAGDAWLIRRRLFLLP